DAVPQEPGEITFTTDERALRVALLHGDGPEKEIDVKRDPKHKLPPGDYTLRLVGDAGRRKLLPERLGVQPGESRALPLGLVGEVRQYAGGRVAAVAAPPAAGSLVVSAGGGDRDLAVWDAAAGQVVHLLKGHEGQVLSVAVSARGELALSGAGGKDDPPDT